MKTAIAFLAGIATGAVLVALKTAGNRHRWLPNFPEDYVWQ
jgi:hypothetical protein